MNNDDKSLNYAVPLEKYDINERYAYLTLPKALTERDAERLVNFIRAVAFPDQEYE